MLRRSILIRLLVALPLAGGIIGQVWAAQPGGKVHSFVLTAVAEMWLANGYPGVRGETSPVRFETRVWYAAPDRWRIERYYLRPPAEPTLARVFKPNSNVMVRNGPIVWTYDASSHTYASRSPLSSSVAPSGPPLQFEAAAMGESFPSTASSSALSLPALLKLLAACDTARIVPISTPKVVGRATVLGRPTYVIDFGDRPCGWNSNSAHEIMGRRLIWVDQQTFFVLKVVRYSVYHTHQLFDRATLKGLRYNVALPASRFIFTPPLGARPAPSTPPPVAPTTVKPLAVIRRQVSFPIALPTWLPHDLRLKQSSVDGEQRVTMDYSSGDRRLSLLEGPVGCCLDADPRKYGGPTLPDGRSINVLDVGAQYGGLILWWDQGRTYIALSSSTLNKAEFMRIAMSIPRIPTARSH